MPNGRIYDIHCHMHCDAADIYAQPLLPPARLDAVQLEECTRSLNAAQMKRIEGKLTQLDLRLVDMDRDDVDVQVLSPTPQQFFYELPAEAGRVASRMVNDYLAKQAARMPERFVTLGTVPLQNVEMACTELSRCRNDLNIRGVEISCNVDGEDLSSERLAPFFAHAEQLDMLIFLHPMPDHGRRLSKFYLNSLIANPLESTIAVSHLIMGGVLDRHPGLKVCVAHGGGYLPTYTGRMDHAFKVRADCRQNLKHAPSHYLKRLYFDTVVFDREHVHDLVRRYGADHVVMGTDYAYDMEVPAPVDFIRDMPGLSDEQKHQILSSNAQRLLFGDHGV